MSEVETTLGDLARNVWAEVGLQLIEDILLYMKWNHPMMQLSTEKIRSIIEQGDALYDAADHLPVEEKEAFDMKTE